MSISYTPEEITEILNDYFNGITHKQYIGARYVPIFGRKNENSIIWDNTGTYEPLTIVLYQGNSYTSRQYVPIGVEITNEAYWAMTGNYNAQVEAYRQEVLNYVDDLENLKDKVDTIKINVSEYGAVGDGTTDDYNAIKSAFDNAKENDFAVIEFDDGKIYYISEYVSIDDSYLTINGNGATIKHDNDSGFIFSKDSHDITVKNLSFLGTFNVGTDDYSNSNIAIAGPSTTEKVEAHDFTFDGCVFNGGVFGLAMTNVERCTIKNCRFSNHVFKVVDGAGGYGILLQSSHQVTVENCKFDYGDYSRHAVYVSVSQIKVINKECSDIIIRNNIVDMSNMEVLPNYTSYYSPATTNFNIRTVTNIIIENNIGYECCGMCAFYNVDGDIRNAIFRNNILIDPVYFTGVQAPAEIRSLVQTTGTLDNKCDVTIDGNLVIADAYNTPATLDCSVSVGNVKFINTKIRFRVLIENCESFLGANCIVEHSGGFYFTAQQKKYVKITGIQASGSNDIPIFSKSSNAYVSAEYFDASAMTLRYVDGEGGGIRDRHGAVCPITAEKTADGLMTFTFTNMSDHPSFVSAMSSGETKMPVFDVAQSVDNTILVKWIEPTTGELYEGSLSATYKFN